MFVTEHARQLPDTPIVLTAHSGGCGVAIWTLEQLPDDVKVDTVLLLAPALSPGYDLSKALRHVRGNVYVFSSLHDKVVLYAGTRIFGTIDGVMTESAGYCGFVAPPGADQSEYRKLIPCPYQESWKQYGDFGDHLGPMARAFAATILAPLLEKPPTTQPSASNAE
jgi:pimeloyl-ACP methyl ester carboxylesterase